MIRHPWGYVIFVAVLIGIVEYIPAAFLAAALPFKLTTLDDVLKNSGLTAFVFANMTFAVVCVGGATLLTVLVAPSAAGSGIPGLIAYLSNGVMGDRQLLAPLTVLVKMLGVVLAIVGGLPIGREGPAIHIGAAFGDISSNIIAWIEKKWTGVAPEFDGYLKHNVIMMGSAAGFASAFRSPIGGFMYCTEEIATHWDIKEHMQVGCQTFVAVAIAAFVTNSMVRVTADSGTIEFSSIVIFGDEEAALNAGVVWEYNDIPGFLITAVIAGIFGGFTAKACVFINKWRATQEFLKPWYMRLLDASCTAIVVSLVLSLIPSLYTNCVPIGSSGSRMLAGAGNRRYVQYTCEDTHYSELASLTLSGEEGVIRHLMSRDDIAFDVYPLLIFLVFYIPIMILSMGLKLPCGSFVPNLLLGSCIGRICGEWVTAISASGVSHPGVYALIGAAALLGSWTRTMIAVVVTLIEISGDVGLGKPLIIVVVIARQISIHISHHSYTHELFYGIVDDITPSGVAKILHPNDWTDPLSPIKRVHRTSMDIRKAVASEDEDQDTSNEESFTQLKKPSLVKAMSQRPFVPDMAAASPK
eukprot:GSChrysophyteH1.ASY1.ANO1.1741.1 assembled CDS